MIALWRNDPVAAQRALPRHYVEAVFVTILVPPLLGMLMMPIARLIRPSGQLPPTWVEAVLFGARWSFLFSWSGVLPGVLIMGIMQRSGIGGLLPVLAMSVLLLPLLSCVYLWDSCRLSNLFRLPPADTAAMVIGFAALAWVYLVIRVPAAI